MDKLYSAPKDVSNTSFDDVVRGLNRALRTIRGTTNFIYQAEFEYANGRKAPLLMVGALRGAWREYVRRHASSPGFAAGECEIRKDQGKTLLDLKASRGKGATPSHARTLNAGPLRRMSVEARFVTALSAGDAGSDTARGAATLAGAESAEGSGNADPEALGKAILDAFAGFKASPTMAGLESLAAEITRFRGLGATGSRFERQIDQIATLLETKGRAFVQQKGGRGET